MKKNILYILIALILAGCYGQDCNKENIRIQKLSYNFKITKKYKEDHQGVIEGIDSLGKIQKFQYTSFFYLDDLAQPGDSFQKDSTNFIFILRKEKIKYSFKWDCTTSGVLLQTDTLHK
ncbi:lipoprotein [Solitalea canadensis]|uniref:Type IV secretion system putative lipoprotein virB7 n=1 Tax=Solitalea canadensis (strain ATCC 29591 / DSM 3403 / JCM 21819 / LMG 8368 / NBRC 15130 / NCIMB 12057 / USAM 9D) TaxID=929556 RepID=H8KLN1_SOLCM|nr:lipoprotein [Solitalea canadensis]AFD09185.1 hypothetical protein Solca_4195 [Solitalea canadensis DSM 3403]